MDGTQFDTLIKRLATTPLTRSTALRGLGASVAALAGATLVAQPGAARKRNNKNDEPERRVCHCSDPTGASCRTLKKEKSKVKRHLRKHVCDYRGRCQGFSGCCLGNTAACTSSAQCCTEFCGDGVCQPRECTNQGEKCETTAECCAGVCNAGGSNIDGTADECATCVTLGGACTAASECCDTNAIQTRGTATNTECPPTGPGANTCCVPEGANPAAPNACPGNEPGTEREVANPACCSGWCDGTANTSMCI